MSSRVDFKADSSIAQEAREMLVTMWLKLNAKNSMMFCQTTLAKIRQLACNK